MKSLVLLFLGLFLVSVEVQAYIPQEFPPEFRKIIAAHGGKPSLSEEAAISSCMLELSGAPAHILMPCIEMRMVNPPSVTQAAVSDMVSLVQEEQMSAIRYAGIVSFLSIVFIIGSVALVTRKAAIK